MFVEYMWLFVIVFFFFFKQKTAYEMRISDWSSDVCSSDLQRIGDDQRQRARALLRDPDDRAVEQIGGRSRAQGPSLAVGDHLARAVARNRPRHGRSDAGRSPRRGGARSEEHTSEPSH